MTRTYNGTEGFGGLKKLELMEEMVKTIEEKARHPYIPRLDEVSTKALLKDLRVVFNILLDELNGRGKMTAFLRGPTDLRRIEKLQAEARLSRADIEVTEIYSLEKPLAGTYRAYRAHKGAERGLVQQSGGQQLEMQRTNATSSGRSRTGSMPPTIPTTAPTTNLGNSGIHGGHISTSGRDILPVIRLLAHNYPPS
ncbi:hypothetical protein D9757_009345 [Collybiopsis confluens]|uniref:Uncharacterized protein n=1 Tax=Collybiopsis confluens TaxID=2823264 RepID=A0A8H5H3R7_9AGAR|nr:hypothetical protein D9757_009345 [Collybiopsis confluens]